jgi:hypothetical protein
MTISRTKCGPTTYGFSGWPEDSPGIACTETALVPFDTLPQTNKRLSKPIDDATEVGEPTSEFLQKESYRDHT